MPMPNPNPRPAPVAGAVVGPAHTAGVYQYLLDAEEADYRQWLESVHGSARGAQYPRARRLGALRAGQPIMVAVAELPPALRPVWAPTPPGWFEPGRWVDRQHLAAEVHADDRVVQMRADESTAVGALDEYRDL
ncbi:hypothetical protein [Mycolicibacter sinensis]|uniref:hypothetical protein n=1 Tax=Mycolicibacter sinensis (strain JDM601) TaxID=875328 RepID=UPI0007E93AE1|nr:hypothetical protein [Mycolicibacter sinensis]OBH20524.1 hypothetical protein A5694_16325 [Mycolicibacter sinensis]